MNPANYSEFELQDFLEDDFFVQWVINPDENKNSFWQSFTENYRHKKELVSKAADTIRLYRQQNFLGNEENKGQVWQRISQSIKQADTVQKKRIFRMPVFLRVAASLIIVAGIALWLSNRYSDKTYTIATVSGQIKTITLPDNSKVTLNGNSTLSYKGDWDNKEPREVWIKGEGYFDVRHLNKDSLHINPSDRFIVHCGDVNIEVLGTTFNVKARSGKTNVALLTGKIRIDYVATASNSKPLILAPGDYVEYAGEKLLVNKKLAKPAQVSSWKSDEISFTDATLKEITETLQDRFGYTVNTEDESLLQWR
jgi:ferric-dicitrate binding protein FerR (iron transport regulator)